MKTKVLFLTILLIAFIGLLNAEEALTEEQALEQIEMEQARLDAANAKLAELKPVCEELQAKYDELVAEKTKLEEELANLKETRGFYTVKYGDWLSKLAEYPEVYGKGNWRRWPEIYKANKRLIKDPNLIYPNWKLVIPRP